MLIAKKFLVGIFPVALLAPAPAYYPVDGYRESGIRRLELLRLRLNGDLRGSVPVPTSETWHRDQEVEQHSVRAR